MRASTKPDSAQAGSSSCVGTAEFNACSYCVTNSREINISSSHLFTNGEDRLLKEDLGWQSGGCHVLIQCCFETQSYMNVLYCKMCTVTRFDVKTLPYILN